MFTRIHSFLTQDRDRSRQAHQRQQAADAFDLAPAKGFPYYLKFALFLLFGYYNAKLFIKTVPGWEGWMTALFALALEGLALYCIVNYVRSANGHKWSLGFFGIVLTLFSVTHATLSYFNVAEHAKWGRAIEFYSHNVAFPLLFGLLFVSSIVIYLSHFRQKVAMEQARSMVEIKTQEARHLAQSAAMRAEAALDREKLAHLEEQMKIEAEYVGKLESFVQLKQREMEIVNGITDPALREKVALELGLKIGEGEPWPTALPSGTPGKP